MADLSLVSESIPEVMKIKSAFDPEALAMQKDQLQHRMTHVKTSYVFLSAKNQFMDSLYMDPSQWPSMAAADEALQEATDELDAVKEEMSTVKTTMESLCEAAQEGIAMLVEKRKLLVGKQKELLEKKSILERHTSKGSVSNKKKQEETRKELLKGIDVATAAILKCNCAIDRLKSEICRQDPVVARLEEAEVKNSYRLRDVNSDQERWMKEFAQLGERLRHLVEDIEQLGGVTVAPVGWSTLRVDFPTSSPEASSVQLSLLLDFSVNNIGHLILQSAKKDVGSIDASDLLRKAVAENDVPALVTKLKSQWRSYQPLITEISHLRQRSAVDWIQNEGLLRVMVGQFGKVVCTLVIPPSYPQSGEVTLADIQGQFDDNMDIKPPGHDKTLTRWVDFLETKFGQT